MVLPVYLIFKSLPNWVTRSWLEVFFMGFFNDLKCFVCIKMRHQKTCNNQVFIRYMYISENINHNLEKGKIKSTLDSYIIVLKLYLCILHISYLFPYLYDLFFCPLNLALNVQICLFVSNCISYTNWVTFIHKPLVDYSLLLDMIVFRKNV